ncbi:MAG TPA: PSD1 and planctomycete cytochrome C domain-containing protein [Bryobacteraceae bacterium]|nr:PSD1 and planctomycete cytochrome C domain-containing protein [Bryobacteraceae bacterium]
MLRAGMGWFVLLACAYAQTPPRGAPDYARDVQPLLEKRCYGCHGPQQQMKGLRFDQRDVAMRVIQPGNSAASRMIQMVSGTEKLVMPPIGERLSAAEIGMLRAWIDAGARWPVTAKPAVHWSFLPPRRPAVPAVRDRAWPRNVIDDFVLAKLEAEGVAPSPEAGKAVLLRRLSLDLTGLPPTPEELDRFLRDNRADAYEREVDRLLDSPHYGEKWGRFWLDLARYADSDGYEKDRSRPWAWRYRQWVIDAINRDMPYDEFTIEQLAGDLLPDRTIDTLIATGFNRNTLTNREGGTDPEQFRDEQVLDRAATLGTVWLGLTVGCAQCHNHKYDPISQKEFYQIAAFFNTQEEVNIPAPMAGETGPYLEARPGYDERKRALLAEYRIPENETDWEDKLRYASLHPGEHDDWTFAYGEFTHTVDNAQKVLFKPVAQRSELEQNQMLDDFLGSCGALYPKQHCADLKVTEVRKKLEALNATLPPYSYAPVLVESDAPPKEYVHLKGDWRDRGEEVHPEMLAVLPPLPAGAPHTRLTLARWIVAPDNPLTARVAVNRIWQEVFGRGIVNTSEDFGTQGDRPSHPELLDWLATEYVARGWSQKQMIRLMVTSSTYRQSSHARPELEQKDPDNTLLARQARLRLPAELIRDQALAAAGLLDLRIGGPSVKPPQPKGVAELSYAGSVKWVESKGADRYRRGMYIHFQRTTPYPQLMNFDAPNASLSCTRRERTNTPLQALNLLNDPVFLEAAQGLAFRVMREAPAGFGGRLNYAMRLTLARDASPREAERLGKYYDETLRKLEADRDTVTALFPNRIEGVAQTEAAAWVEVSHVLLNLDEFITRE